MEKLFQNEYEDFAVFRKIVEVILEDVFTATSIAKTIPVNIPMADYKTLLADLKIMLKNSDFNIPSIQKGLSDYDPVKVSCFIEAVTERRTKLMLRSICEHNSVYGDTAIGFDWRLKLVLGSSAYNELQYSVLELDLQTVNSKKKFELTKVELEKLINTLENYK